MSRFKKLFVLLLSLVLIATSFAVVALATDEVDREELKDAAVLKFYDFNNGELGSLTFEANDDGKGTFVVQNTDGYPDNYIEHYVSSGTGNDSYLSGPYQGNTKYSFTKYPYFAMDFDIMKISGDYAGASLYPIFYATGTVYDELGKLVSTVKNASAGSTSFSIANIKTHLPKDFYEWAHVTVIFKFNDGITEDSLGVYAYVDGECVYSNDKYDDIPDKYDPSFYYFGTFRINSSGTTNVKNKSGYDNWKLTFFNEYYTLDEVASYTYNEKYEKPFSTSRAIVGYHMFDDVNKAVEFASAGEAVSLTKNAEKPIAVNKSIMIDTNAYDDRGNLTGERYTFEYTGDGRYIPNGNIEEDEDGIIEFLKRNNASVKVYWDECSTCQSECTEHPSEACGCTCNSLVPGHTMYLETNASLFAVPVYPGKTPTFEINEDGSSMEFLGWSYTKDGEAEELVAITAEDAERGYLDIYPVYKETQYSFAVITSSGNVTYFMEEDAAAAFAYASTGDTVKLLTDVTVKETISLVKNITIDLNGFTLGRMSAVYTDYAAEGEEGAYTKGESLGTVNDGTSGYFFDLLKGGATKVLITSSRAGAKVYNVRVKADRLLLDGDVVATENVSVAGKSLFNHYGIVCDVTILGENITFYVDRITYNEHGGNKGSSYNIDGGVFYHLEGGTDSLFQLYRKGEHTIKNATFYSNQYIARTDSDYINEAITLTFENCDLIGGKLNSVSDNHSFIYNNCRITSTVSNVSRSTVGIGTLMTKDLIASGANPALNAVVIPASKSVSYDVPTSYVPSYNVLTGELAITTAQTEKSFTYEAADAATMQATTVRWDPACDDSCDCYGNAGGHVLASETIVPVDFIPAFTGSIPKFETTADGVTIKLIGWSYTKGGEAEELIAITAEDVERGYLNLYPVYESAQNSFAVTKSDGTTTFYMEDEAATAFTAAAGSTVKLLCDTKIYGAIALTKNITFDLNGFTLTRIGATYTDYAATGEAGAYTKDGESIGTTTVGKSGYLFTIASKGATDFKLTSSRPGAKLYSVSVKADRLLLDGEVVAIENVTTAGKGLISHSGIVCNITILGENITFYVDRIIYSEHGANKGSVYNIDGGVFYHLSGGAETLLDIQRKGEHYIKNATFYAASNRNIARTDSDYATEVITLHFDNCDFVNGRLNVASDVQKFILNNCRVSCTLSVPGRVTMGLGTVMTKDYVTSGALVCENGALESASESVTYDVPSSYTITYDVLNDEFIFNTKSTAKNFTYEIVETAAE